MTKSNLRNRYGLEPSPALRALYEARSELYSERNAILTNVWNTMTARWAGAGGCTACLGHERVVTWSTLDGPGWTEYGPCDKCSDASKAAGKQPFSYWAGGYSAASTGTPTVNELFTMPEFRTQAVLVNTYDMHLEFVAAEIAREEDRITVSRDKQVVVVKGRKVPVGTKGRCFWVGETKYGTRVGFESESGETFWTAYDNVAVANATAA